MGPALLRHQREDVQKGGNAQSAEGMARFCPPAPLPTPTPMTSHISNKPQLRFGQAALQELMDKCQETSGISIVAGDFNKSEGPDGKDWGDKVRVGLSRGMGQG